MPTTRRTLTRSTVLAASLALLGACATGGAGRGPRVQLDPAEVQALVDSLNLVRLDQQLAEQGRDEGPRVRIWTDDGIGGFDEIRANFRLEDDAYVAVFNVGPDGRVHAVYPESPEDDGFLRGGNTYRIPAFFPGFGLARDRVGYGSYGTSRGYLRTGYPGGGGTFADRGGYIFIVASWLPLALDELEAQDGWDTYQFASQTYVQSPFQLSRMYAETLVPRGRRWYTVDYRYYGQHVPGALAMRDQCDIMMAYGMPSISLLRLQLARGTIGRAHIMSLFNRLAFSGCNDSFYRVQLLALLNGTQWGTGQPGTGPVIPPSTGGGDSTSVLGSGSTASQPAPGETKERPRGRKIDDAGEITRQPRKPDRSGVEDDVIELGNPGGRKAESARTRTRSASRPSSDPRIARTGRQVGVDEDGVVRLARPRPESRPRQSDGWARTDRRSSGSSAAEPRVNRERPEPRSEPRTETRETPRSEPRQAPVSAPRPRVERSSAEPATPKDP